MPIARFFRRICGCCSELLLHYEHEKTDESLHFADKKRKIDYILVYRVEDEEDKVAEKGLKDMISLRDFYPANDEEDEEEEKAKIREIYQQNLEKKGVHMEIEPKEKSQDGKTCFVKLHVPWHILLKYAERMKTKMPLKKEKDEDEEDSDECCEFSWFHKLTKKMSYPLQLHNNLIEEMFGGREYYTAEFARDKIQYFDIVDEKTFFSNAERSRIAHRILDETIWGESRKNLGIDRLLLNGVYEAAYPLHDGSTDELAEKTTNMRQLLYREWARWGRWYKYQPLEAIRHYLGDKVGIFFAWLGYYTRMLTIISIIGVACLFYGLGTFSSFAPVLEFCDPSDPNYAGNFTMCPLCDTDCTYWKLGSSCDATRLTQVFDNEATIFYAVVVSIWVVFFLEFWKRRQYRLAYEWDLADREEGSELIRPEYEAKVDRERFNPATGKREAMMHPVETFKRAAFSGVTVIFWVLLVIAAVFSVIIYKLVVHATLTVLLDSSSLSVQDDVKVASLLTSVTSAIISLLVIMVLNKVYLKVAIWLTNLETPRTRVEYDSSFTLKVFCFQFVNFYSTLFYIAFFKNSFTGHPGNYTYLFGRYRWEGCEPGGCMYELTVQLFVIMGGKQAFNNFMQLFVPWAKKKYREYRPKKGEEPADTRWENDFNLAPIDLELFYEYLELVIQFGFVTLFAAAFPLAPLLALINNLIKIRLNGIKFIHRLRRPLAFKISSIGAWFPILEFIGILSIVTNAFIIALTSEAIPRVVYYYIYSPIRFGVFTYRGYVSDSLSIFNVADFSPESAPFEPQPFSGEVVTQCRYKNYRSTTFPYELTTQYWRVITAKLAFIIVMEHCVFAFKGLLHYIIPDRPKKLVAQIKREETLVQNMLVEAEKEQIIRGLSVDQAKIELPSNGLSPASGEFAATLTNENETTKSTDEAEKASTSSAEKDETSASETSTNKDDSEKPSSAPENGAEARGSDAPNNIDEKTSTSQIQTGVEVHENEMMKNGDAAANKT